MSKEDIKNFLQFKEVARPPFMPLVCFYAAKLEQVSVKTMLTNPTKLSNALQKTQRLLGYDAIFNIIDPTLEAEVCGCQISWSGENEIPRVVSHPLEEGKTVDQLPLLNIEERARIPIVLETTKRLQMVVGNKVDIIGVLTGPLILSYHLGGETFIKNFNKDDLSGAFRIISYANTIIVHLCKLYCERKVDGILVCDTLISELSSDSLQLVMPFYRTLFNIIKHFNIYLIISVGSPPAEAVENIFKLDANGFVISGVTEVDHIVHLAAKENKLLGYGIPNSALLRSADQLREIVRKLIPKARRGVFLTTEEQIPYATPIGNMYELMNILLTKNADWMKG